MKSVAPNTLKDALEHVHNGGTLCIPTYTSCQYIDKKCLTKFEKAGYELLKEEGKGFRMMQGKKTVYLLPGQLSYMD